MTQQNTPAGDERDAIAAAYARLPNLNLTVYGAFAAGYRAAIAKQGAGEPVDSDRMVLVQRGLLAAAAEAIEHKRSAPNTLAALRIASLSAPPAQQPTESADDVKDETGLSNNDWKQIYAAIDRVFEPSAAQDGRRESLVERLRIHSEDQRNTAFSRSTMREVLEVLAAPAQPANLPDGWEDAIYRIRNGLDDATPSAYDNGGYRDYAASVLDGVIDELRDLPLAQPAKLTDAEAKSAKYLNQIAQPGFLHYPQIGAINEYVQRAILAHGDKQ